MGSSHQLKILSTSAPTACSVLHLRLEAPLLHGQDPAINPGWVREGVKTDLGVGAGDCW